MTPNYYQRSAYTPNDELIDAQQWVFDAVKLQKAWDITRGNQDVVIAVIDSGIDYQHEDLVDKLWVNAGEIPNNGKDDDGNGFVDDIIGYDFVNAGESVATSPARISIVRTQITTPLMGWATEPEFRELPLLQPIMRSVSPAPVRSAVSWRCGLVIELHMAAGCCLRLM